MGRLNCFRKSCICIYFRNWYLILNPTIYVDMNQCTKGSEFENTGTSTVGTVAVVPINQGC